MPKAKIFINNIAIEEIPPQEKERLLTKCLTNAVKAIGYEFINEPTKEKNPQQR